MLHRIDPTTDPDCAAAAAAAAAAQPHHAPQGRLPRQPRHSAAQALRPQAEHPNRAVAGAKDSAHQAERHRHRGSGHPPLPAQTGQFTECHQFGECDGRDSAAAAAAGQATVQVPAGL